MEIAKSLRDKARHNILATEPPAFDVELLTGRIRPVERDDIIDKIDPYLHSDPKKELEERPLVLVCTQCLEVGADFSFDALITECASLDALRQRFGRLARLANQILLGHSFCRRISAQGNRSHLRRCTEGDVGILWSRAKVDTAGKGKEIRHIDFGFEAMRKLLPPPEELRALLALAPDAPILLPAHLDLLCQTSPRPHPDPDIGLFLHGKGSKSAEVRVAFRCDFRPGVPGGLGGNCQPSAALSPANCFPSRSIGCVCGLRRKNKRPDRRRGRRWRRSQRQSLRSWTEKVPHLPGTGRLHRVRQPGCNLPRQHHPAARVAQLEKALRQCESLAKLFANVDWVRKRRTSGNSPFSKRASRPRCVFIANALHPGLRLAYRCGIY